MHNDCRSLCIIIIIIIVTMPSQANVSVTLIFETVALKTNQFVAPCCSNANYLSIRLCSNLVRVQRFMSYQVHNISVAVAA